MNRILVTKRMTFEAAHYLPGYQGKCRNMHGHSYKVEVTIACSDQAFGQHASGMVVDFSKVKATMKKYIVDKFDHKVLNDIVENPTAERLVSFLWDVLYPVVSTELPSVSSGIFLHRIRLWETEDSYATIEVMR